MIGRSWRSVAPPAVVALLVLGVGVLPTYRASADVDAQTAAAQAQFADLQFRAATLTPLVQSGDVLEAELLALDRLVPAEHDLAGFIIELDEIADAIGFALLDVVPQPEDGQSASGTPGGWTSIELSLRMRGTYVQLIDFAEAVTTTQRLAIIDSVSITSGGAGQIETSVELRLFRNDAPAHELIARYVDSKPEVDQ